MKSKGKRRKQSSAKKSRFEVAWMQRLLSFFVSLAYKYLVVFSILFWITLCSIAILYSFTNESPLDPSNWGLYLIFLWVSMALTGIFPVSYFAYLYYQNNRSQTARIRNDFKLLGLVTEEEYDNFDKMYETFYDPMQFGTFIILLVVISNVIIATFFVTRGRNLTFISSTQAGLLFYAFLGAYLFGVRLVVRRYNTFDLQPQVYSSIILRIIVSGAIAFGISSLLQGTLIPVQNFGALPTEPQVNTAPDEIASSEDNQSTEVGERASSGRPQKDELLPWQIVAFLIGVFPEQGLRWLSIIARRAFRDTNPSQFNERSLRKIVGINEWHEARLEELGIDDSQSLATCNISKLLLTTQFDTMQAINWIDQAILHMKVGARVDQFLAFQITTYHELYSLLKKMKVEKIGAENNEQSTNIKEHPEIKDILAEISIQLNGNSQQSFTNNEYNKLLVALGFTYSELERLCDYSNYPNYIRIQEYYRNLDNITRERAKQGTEEIIRSIDIGGEIVGFSSDDIVESLDDQQKEVIEKQIQELSFDLSACSSTRQRIGIELRLGKLHYLFGDLDEALSMYNMCIDEFQGVTLDNKEKSKIYAARGLSHIALGNRYRNATSSRKNDRENGDGNSDFEIYYQNAISDNILATHLDPSNVDAFNNCAIAYIEQENFSLALESLERALWLNRQNGVAYYNRGTIKNTIGKTDKDFIEAELDFERAYLLGYQPAALWATWGLILVNTGRYQEAINHLTKAISLCVDNFTFYSRRGFAYLQLSKHAKQDNSPTTFHAYTKLSSSDFRKAINLVKNNQSLVSPESQDNALTVTYINYGQLKKLEGKHEEAIEFYSKVNLDRARALRKTDFFHNFANAHLQQGVSKGIKEGSKDFEIAISLFNQEIEIGNPIVEAYYQLAVSHSWLGQVEKAKSYVTICREELCKIRAAGQNATSMYSSDELRFLEGNLKKLDTKLSSRENLS